MCLPTWKFAEPGTFGNFIVATSHRQDQLLPPYPAPLPSLEEGGEAEIAKLFILATSFGDRPHPGTTQEAAKSCFLRTKDVLSALIT